MGAFLPDLLSHSARTRSDKSQWSNVLPIADACHTTLNQTAERFPRPQVVDWSTCTKRSWDLFQNAVTPKRPCSVSNLLDHESSPLCASARITSPEPTEVCCAPVPSEAELFAPSWSRNRRLSSKCSRLKPRNKS